MYYLKYRILPDAFPPRQIKLDRPGWAGEMQSGNGSVPQPWHCQPFVDASTYGLELIYPFKSECIVSKENNEIKFSGDFVNCPYWDGKPPFAVFSPNHYGFTSSVDLDFADDLIIRLEPHPRFYTDTTDTVPIAVPGHLQSWWSHIFFVVFKAPSEGQKHIFRYNEPYAQLLIMPKKVGYEIKEMSDAERKEREIMEYKINKFGRFISKNAWRDHKGNVFDDKYKVLSSAFNKEGTIDNVLEKAEKQALNTRPKKLVNNKII